MKKYYEILEVSPKASKEIIERAYRVLIKKYHPDLYMDEEKIYAEQKIRDINEAYKILSDDFLREQYDLEIQKDIEYDDIYKKNNKYASEKKVETKKKRFTIHENNKPAKAEKSNVGTYKGILDVTKILFQNRPKFKNIKELQREDYIAAALTAIIMIVLLIALWFIPATNGFIKNMLPFLN